LATKVKQTWIFIAHHCEDVSIALPLPVPRRWSPSNIPQPDTSQHCKTMDMG